MVKLVVFSVLVGCFIGCSSGPSEESLREQIMDADRSFSKMAQDKGIAAAFIYYADENVIKPSTGNQPICGKYALMEHFKENPPGENTILTWEPLKAEVSGSIGYTFGGYKLSTRIADTMRDTTYYGNYVSIWKRKKDGSWRYVLDTGNPTPGPLVLEQ